MSRISVEIIKYSAGGKGLLVCSEKVLTFGVFDLASKGVRCVVLSHFLAKKVLLLAVFLDLFIGV